jgi:hypothetical protein
MAGDISNLEVLAGELGIAEEVAREAAGVLATQTVLEHWYGRVVGSRGVLREATVGAYEFGTVPTGRFLHGIHEGLTTGRLNQAQDEFVKGHDRADIFKGAIASGVTAFEAGLVLPAGLSEDALRQLRAESSSHSLPAMLHRSVLYLHKKTADEGVALGEGQRALPLFPGSGPLKERVQAVSENAASVMTSSIGLLPAVEWPAPTHEALFRRGIRIGLLVVGETLGTNSHFPRLQGPGGGQ